MLLVGRLKCVDRAADTGIVFWRVFALSLQKLRCVLDVLQVLDGSLATFNLVQKVLCTLVHTNNLLSLLLLDTTQYISDCWISQDK